MQRSTFKILFYLKRNNIKSDGTVPLMGRITVDGTISQFSCKMNIPPNLWDTKAYRSEGWKRYGSENPRRQVGFVPCPPGHFYQ
jgi:hypothetical protein